MSARLAAAGDRGKRLRFAGAMGLLLALALAAPVAATTKYAGPAGTFWLPYSLFGVNVSFGAAWDISHTQDAGRTWWLVGKLEMTGTMINGDICLNQLETCVAPWLENKAEFLNTAGGVVYTKVNTGGQCRNHFVSPSDVTISRCTVGPMQLSSSINRIRFSWRMHLSGIGIFGFDHTTQWVTQTVPIL
jgi:hypothetical protein